MVDAVVKAFCYTFLSVHPRYYIQHLFWGGLFVAPLVYSGMTGNSSPNWESFIVVVGTLLFYPYTRLAYDYVMDIFFSGMGLIISIKFAFFWYIIRTGILLGVTPFVAPIVLVFLYWYNWRLEKNEELE